MVQFFQDLKTSAVQETVLSTEEPDFVVYSGDAVSGYAWDKSKDWYARVWLNWTAPIVKRQYFYVRLFVFVLDLISIGLHPR